LCHGEAGLAGRVRRDAGDPGTCDHHHSNSHHDSGSHASACDHYHDSGSHPSTKGDQGDHLWGISAKPAVYGDPYQWPLLYKRNRDEIYDPDLIYPGQVLQIERDLSQTQINIAVNHAKTRGAWVLGEIEATDIQYLRKALSW